MAAGDDMTDWAPGQPAPWLAAYGVPPVDSSLAGAPGAPQPELVPPVVDAMAQPVPPLQPGLGIPAAAVDQAAAAPPAPPSFLQQFSGGVADTFSNALPDAAGAIATQARADQTQAAADKQKAADDRTASAVKVATDPTALVQDRQAAWQAIPAETRASIINSSDPKAMAALATAAMSPEELAQIAVRHQQAEIHEDSTARLELARKTEEDAARNWQAQQAALQQANADTAKLVTEAQQLSQQKIDPKEHGVGNFIASVLAGFLGGAESQYTGGRNLALEELDKRTQTRIDAQKADLANQWQGLGFKRNLIAEQYQRSGDLYRAQEAYRVSTYDRAIGELQTKMQDYDPQGTTALRGATAVQQIQAQRAQALQQFGQQQFKNTLDAAKVQFDQQKAAQEAKDKEAQRKLEEANSQRSLYGTMRGQDMTDARARDMLDEQIAARKEAADAAKVGGAGTIGGEAVGVDAAGNVQYGNLKNADGADLVIKNPETHAKVANMLAGADEVNRLTNQLAREIKEWGGQPNFAGKGQKLNADKEALVFALHKAQKIEGFRPGTSEMLDELTGGVDVTSWIKTASPGLLRGRDNINAIVNSTLRREAGYTGKDYKPVDTSSLAEPTADEWDDLEKNIKADPRNDRSYESASDIDKQYLLGFYNQGGRPADAALAQANYNQLSPEQQAQVDAMDPMLLRAYRNGYAPSQIQDFEKLRDAALGKNPTDAKRATAILTKLVGDDTLQPGPRQLAGQILRDENAASVPVDVPDLTDFADTSAAHEQTPPAPPPELPKQKGK